MTNIFDLSQHSSLDLDRLGMAVDTGIAQCSDHKDLRELKETLLSYKNIVKMAREKALERESDDFATKMVHDISKGLIRTMETYEKLDPEFKAKWVAALRSGEYNQGQDKLYNPDRDTYCCLGVAGVVCGVSKTKLIEIGAWYFPSEARENNIPLALSGASGKVSTLMDMNDNGASFSEIADWIEANL